MTQEKIGLKVDLFRPDSLEVATIRFTEEVEARKQKREISVGGKRKKGEEKRESRRQGKRETSQSEGWILRNDIAVLTRNATA